jgi:hypothetical protein
MRRQLIEEYRTQWAPAAGDGEIPQAAAGLVIEHISSESDTSKHLAHRTRLIRLKGVNFLRKTIWPIKNQLRPQTIGRTNRGKTED